MKHTNIWKQDNVGYFQAQDALLNVVLLTFLRAETRQPLSWESMTSQRAYLKGETSALDQHFICALSGEADRTTEVNGSHSLDNLAFIKVSLAGYRKHVPETRRTIFFLFHLSVVMWYDEEYLKWKRKTSV